ncbi:MAG: hypothetical protein IAE78_27870 [Myxococcus sp.]|nr:hypothetical protein [Myxococcus sp.]
MQLPLRLDESERVVHREVVGQLSGRVLEELLARHSPHAAPLRGQGLQVEGVGPRDEEAGDEGLRGVELRELQAARWRALGAREELEEAGREVAAPAERVGDGELAAVVGGGREVPVGRLEVARARGLNRRHVRVRGREVDGGER